MAVSLTKYSRAKWRGLGFRVFDGETVFQLQGGLPRKSDLFGFADLICVRTGELVLLQVTSVHNMRDRLKKIQREKTGAGQWQAPMRDIARDLLSIPSLRIVIDGWEKDARGHYKNRELPVTWDDLDAPRIDFGSGRKKPSLDAEVARLTLDAYLQNPKP